VKLADAWAEWWIWHDGLEERASLEEVFVGSSASLSRSFWWRTVGDDVWAVYWLIYVRFK
jgi:hypothetical protein